MSKIKLSFIVPTLDNKEKLQPTLDSILAQDLKEIELLCIDGGSKDGTLSILKSGEKADCRMRYIQGQRKNCGMLLNRALKEAKGEYVSFVFPGDKLAGDIYRNLCQLAEEKRLDFVQGNLLAGEESLLCQHSSYFGQVFSTAGSYGEKEGPEITDFAEDKGAAAEEKTAIPWLELGRCIAGGIYRKSFLQASNIRFPELPGMAVPAISFWFQVNMHAQRAQLTEEAYYQLGEERQNGKAEDVFKEYDFLGALLRREKKLLEKFRQVYGRAFIQDMLAKAEYIPSVQMLTYMEKAAAFLRDLHAEGMLDYYALAPEEHKAVTAIMYDTERYVEDKLLGETPRMGMEFMFPYHLFPEGSKVAVYGAGNVGRTITRQAMHDGYVQIAGLVDKNAGDREDGELAIAPVKSLKGMEYDYLLIAIRSRSAAEEAKRELIKLGIPEGKIKWDGTAYFRDEFYRNMYFPMLRAWNENYAEHNQFVNAFEIKMKGSINDHIFPYHLFREGAKVALYGAGDIGKKYYRQAAHDGYVKIAGIVDRNPAAIYAPDVPVKAMGELKKMDFDYVLITVHGGGAINAIKNDLKKLGIPEGKIKWDGETYYRDEFYRNVYFPMLRKIGGDFQSRKEMLEAMQKKLRYAIYDHIFPYHLFKEGETIAIYGAGDVGRKFYQQAKDYGWVKCVVIVDKNADKINIPGIPVAPVGALKQFNFDKVLISMTSETYANEARETLIRMGIGEERIKWAGKIYWRDHFYQQYWFDYLRFIHEIRRSKI